MMTDLLATYLDKFGWKQYKVLRQRYQKEGFIKVSWFLGPLDNSFTLFIDPVAEHRLLIFSAFRLALLPDSVPESIKTKVFEKIAEENDANTFGCYGFNSRNNHITYRLVIPMEGADMSYETFIRYLKIAVRACETCGSHVFETLNDAGPSWQNKLKPDSDIDQILRSLQDRFPRDINNPEFGDGE